MTQRENAERSFEVQLGTLGSQIRAAGGITGAVGNSDIGYATGEQRSVRPAALAAMETSGVVELGDVSKRLLKEGPDSPFGIETDLEQFEVALENVAGKTAEHGGPALVVLDAGDAYRAQKFESQVTPEIAAAQRERALRKLDDVVGLAEKTFEDSVVIVASQSTRNESIGRPEGLGPLIVAGNDWTGYVSSSSTQRDGLVTNLDVTATVLDQLGIESPVQVLGNPMAELRTDAALEPRIEQLKRMDRTAMAVDAAKPEVVNTVVALTILILAAGAFVLVRARYWSAGVVKWWVFGLRLAMLFVLSVPVASWLMFAWMRWPSSSAEAVTALVVTLLVVWLGALALSYRAPLRAPIIALCSMTALVLIVDQLLGAPFSFTNFFGYSPILAARFYGIGNEAAAILFGATLVGTALTLDQWPDAAWVPPFKRFGLPVLGALIIGVSAAPFLGANIGVAVWGVVGFGCAWVLFNGYSLSWKTALLLLLVVAAVIAVFAFIDLSGSDQQTHLARSLVSAEKGGIVELWKIVARKAETNLRVLTHTNWAYVLIATLCFVAFMRWRPQGDFAATLTDNPYFADAITVSLITGLVAYFSEDSGIVIPALEVFYVGVALVWLMLARLLATHTSERESGESGAAR
jgi:hypothetical protein